MISAVLIQRRKMKIIIVTLIKILIMLLMMQFSFFFYLQITAYSIELRANTFKESFVSTDIQMNCAAVVLRWELTLFSTIHTNWFTIKKHMNCNCSGDSLLFTISFEVFKQPWVDLQVNYTEIRAISKQEKAIKTEYNENSNELYVKKQL